MCKTKGFTLIEVMVVLSILAIIAILAYNFFGGTMKDATSTSSATKIYNDMRTIEGALDLYHNKNGSYPTIDQEPEYDVVAELVSSGYLKAAPLQLGSTNTYAIRGQSNSPIWDVNSNGIGDIILHSATWSITEDICNEINAKYTTETSIPAVAANPSTQPIICWHYSGDPAGLYRVSKIIEVK